MGRRSGAQNHKSQEPRAKSQEPRAKSQEPRATFLLLVLAFALVPAAPAHAEPVLWYTSAADTWQEALPVGNGRLGGLIFGRIENERIPLNEDTVWAGPRSGGPTPPAYHTYLPEPR